MFEEIMKSQLDGRYEQALTEAKCLSVDLLTQGRIDAAAAALALTGEILCQMNQPSRALGFAQEALGLAGRGDPAPDNAYAHAVAALCRLRLARFEEAERDLDAALGSLNTRPQDERAVFAKLVAAELSLAKEDFAEARAFAEDSLSAAEALRRPSLCARARLLRAIERERSGDDDGAIELLTEADADLAREFDAQTAWMAKGALANLWLAKKRGEAAAACRHEAHEIIMKIAGGLDDENRDPFFKHPSVLAALGETPATESGLRKSPIQVPRARRRRSDDLTLQQLQPVLEVIKKINSELDLRKLIMTILDTMIDLCNAGRGTIVVFDADRFKVEISRVRGKQDLEPSDLGLSKTILALVRDRGRMFVCEDAHATPDLRSADSVQDQHLLSILCVPLRVKTRLVGAVYLDNPEVVGAFGDKEVSLAEVLTDHAAVAIDNAFLHAKSIHDALTNLYNHSHFEERLEVEIVRARRHGRPCGVLMIDIDDFKRVNDSLGHGAGNEMLKVFARLVHAIVRSTDIVAHVGSLPGTVPVAARYGGDEFEVVLPETHRPGLQRVAERLQEAVARETFTYAARPVEIHVSIGGAVFPDDAPDAATLLLRADEALYDAKRAGKNRFVIYRERDGASS